MHRKVFLCVQFLTKNNTGGNLVGTVYRVPVRYTYTDMTLCHEVIKRVRGMCGKSIVSGSGTAFILGFKSG